jgi:2-polyprenyl-3-methyl-5-hydroxy-6-metoxy-1,4-benzoquinol methylase
MSLTKQDLDFIAKQYHENDTINDKFIEDICQFNTYEWVFNHLKSNSKILELGFGEGNFTEELVKRNYNPTILDGSEILLEKAKLKFKNLVKTEHALFEEFNPQTNYDAILATHVLEHVDDPVLLLERMRNWLSPNGIIIIIVPNCESIHRQLAVIMELQSNLDTLGERDKLVGHQRVYSFDTLESDIVKAGYNILDKKGFFLKVLPNSMMLNFNPKLIEALNQISNILPNNLLGNIGIVIKK